MEPSPKPSKKRKQPVAVTSIGEALQQEDPVETLWQNLLSILFKTQHEPNLLGLSMPCQALFLSEVLDREVQNGGFHQFFWNSSGNFTDETKWALAEIGAMKMLSLLNLACALFPDGCVPADRVARQIQLHEFPSEAISRLDELDDKFYQSTDLVRQRINEPENRWFLALLYMEKHANELIASK